MKTRFLPLKWGFLGEFEVEICGERWVFFGCGLRTEMVLGVIALRASIRKDYFLLKVVNHHGRRRRLFLVS